MALAHKVEWHGATRTAKTFEFRAYGGRLSEAYKTTRDLKRSHTSL